LLVRGQFGPQCVVPAAVIVVFWRDMVADPDVMLSYLMAISITSYRRIIGLFTLSCGM
jgi:hypothetical protein